MTTNDFFIILFGIFSVTVIISICVFLYKSYRDDENKILWWRGVKLTGAILGTVGLFLTILSLERSLRDFNAHSRQYQLEQYIELKIFTSYTRAVSCSAEMNNALRKMECAEFSALDARVGPWILRQKMDIEPASFMKENEQVKSIYSKAKRYLNDIYNAQRHANEEPVLGSEARIKVTLVAIVLLVVSLGISVGEAGFQFFQEKKKRKKGLALNKGNCAQDDIDMRPLY